MAKLVGKNSDFYLREKDIMVNTPSLVAIGTDDSIYINVDINEIRIKEVRYDFEGIIPINENIGFNKLNIEDCKFSFNHNVNTKNISINIKNSKIVSFNLKGKNNFDYSVQYDLIEFCIENSLLDSQVFLFSKKIIINTKEIATTLENVLKGHLSEKIFGYIFYYGNEISINTHKQKLDCILPYINFLKANREFEESMIEEYSERIRKSKENIDSLEKSIKELNKVQE